MAIALHTLATRAVEPLRWLIIAGIAYTLATGTLFFLAGPESAPAGVSSQSPSRIPDRSAKVSINAILSRNLFGAADADDATPVVAQAAVATRLPLELRGVFVGDVAEASAAIVAQKGKAGELYAIGAMLPGNAELLEVWPDHIILRRAGTRETLNFPEFSSSGLVSANTGFNGGPGSSDMIDEAPIDAAPWPPEDVPFEEPSMEETQQAEFQPADQAAATPRELVNQYRQILADDPEGALADLGIAAVNAGNAEGYRLDSLSANSPYLQQTGLQPGDVILSVNGQAVGDIQRDQQQIDSVLSQGSARLEVQRGSRRFFVTASLNQ